MRAKYKEERQTAVSVEFFSLTIPPSPARWEGGVVVVSVWIGFSGDCGDSELSLGIVFWCFFDGILWDFLFAMCVVGWILWVDALWYELCLGALERCGVRFSLDQIFLNLIYWDLMNLEDLIKGNIWTRFDQILKRLNRSWNAAFKERLTYQISTMTGFKCC